MANEADHWDVIVIGAGIIGSWTAYHLVRNGQRTLLLDQFGLPHTRGSSRGQSRTFKMTGYPDMPLIKDAFREWHQLARDVGENLIIKTGRLTFSENTSRFLETWSEKMKEHDIEHQVLNTQQLAARFPKTIHQPTGKAIYEVNGSLLQAHKCLTAVHHQFKAQGGVIKDNTKVLSIVPKEKGVGYHSVVTLSNGTNSQVEYRARKIVVTAGPWADKLLPELRPYLNVMTALHVYWKSTVAGAYSVASGFPVISQTPEKQTYGVPSFEYEDLVKVANMYGQTCDPDERDTVDMDNVIDHSRQYVKQHLPLLDATRPIIVEKCMFTYTKDKEFIMDRHPSHPDIVIGAGFSGEGFMGSPGSGKLLAYMAMDTESQLPYNLNAYKMARFLGNAKM